MTIRVNFLGGPLDGQIGQAHKLMPFMLFAVERDRAILCYARENEVSYVYDRQKSATLTLVYDEAKRKITENGLAVVFNDADNQESGGR